MRVVVTGGAGYIGSVTVHELLRAGHEVVVVDDLSRGHRSAVPPGVRLVIGGHGDRAVLDELLPGAGCVMHFSACSIVPESMRYPGKYFRNNVADGLTLLEAMVDHGVRRFVFSSTAATYGEPEVVPIAESAPTNPTNPYGASKLMFERLIEWYERIHGVRSVRLRYFNAAGAIPEAGEDHTPETHLIPIALDVARGRVERLEIYGDDYPTPDGTCVRDYIHVRDLARAHVLALGRLDDGASGVFNLGNGNGFSVREVVAVAAEVASREVPAVVAPRRPGDPPILVASSERAARELGWAPEHPDLREIVRSAWEWMSAHPDGYPD
jgi:UDP-glucose 4-epimerase